MDNVILPRVACAVLFMQILGCGSDSPTQVGDTEAPSRVEDLSILSSGHGAVSLSWTSPGDNGVEGRASGYELKASRMALTEAQWESATLMDAGTPGLPGVVDTVHLAGLELGSWYFGVRVADEVPNWSPLSNVASADVAGLAPPEGIVDLRVIAVTAATATLEWTVPETEVGATYDARYLAADLSEAEWATASPIGDEPAPGVPGSLETLVVHGLEPATTYYFGVKTANEPPNWSPLSNVASATTDDLGIRQLTHSPGSNGAYQPDWSPAGDRIVFYADWGERFLNQLYAIDLATETAVKLTSLPEGTERARWAPDGATLAFLGNRPDGSATRRELWTMPAVVGGAATMIASHSPLRIVDLAWSPDGTQIAYRVEHPHPPGSSTHSVYVVGANGGTPELLIPPTYRMSGLDWSPDGTYLAAGSDESGNMDIWVFPLGGGVATQLTDDPASDLNPAWSPDGSRIAFSSDRSGTYDVWVVPSEGGTAVQQTVESTSDGSPTWSPDGSQIAFGSFDFGTTRSDIFILGVDF